jgi:hypothetical protein
MEDHQLDAVQVAEIAGAHCGASIQAQVLGSVSLATPAALRTGTNETRQWVLTEQLQRIESK